MSPDAAFEFNKALREFARLMMVGSEGFYYLVNSGAGQQSFLPLRSAPERIEIRADNCDDGKSKDEIGEPKA